MSRDQMEKRFGRPGIRAILYASHEEEMGTRAILKAHGRRVVPKEAWDELRQACGGKLTWEARAPRSYNPNEDRDEGATA